jgi:hypothetical protein
MLAEANQFASEDAQKLFDVCSDLKRVCYVLWDPEKGLSTDNNVSFLILPPFAL